MKLLLTFIQIFSALITIISAVGLFGIPEKFQEYGIPVNQLQIAFGLSLFFVLLSFAISPKITQSSVNGDKKIQFQFFGRNNKQE